MNIQAIILSARALATIIPADPLAAGSYQVGHQAKSHDLSAVSQLFSIKASAMDADAVLDLDAGSIAGGGVAVIAGGGGIDADGQTVDLTEIHVIHLRNTGLTRITALCDSWTGGDPPFESIDLPAGGEAMFVLPAGEVVTAAQITFSTDAAGGAFEFLVLGKN